MATKTRRQAISLGNAEQVTANIDLTASATNLDEVVVTGSALSAPNANSATRSAPSGRRTWCSRQSGSGLRHWCGPALTACAQTADTILTEILRNRNIEPAFQEFRLEDSRRFNRPRHTCSRAEPEFPPHRARPQHRYPGGPGELR